jgi:uncharacterized protein (DUF983 family)
MPIKAMGKALNEAGDEWSVECPGCGKGMEFSGFFDPEDSYTCDHCGTEFQITRIWLNDREYF